MQDVEIDLPRVFERNESSRKVLYTALKDFIRKFSGCWRRRNLIFSFNSSLILGSFMQRITTSLSIESSNMFTMSGSAELRKFFSDINFVLNKFIFNFRLFQNSILFFLSTRYSHIFINYSIESNDKKYQSLDFTTNLLIFTLKNIQMIKIKLCDFEESTKLSVKMKHLGIWNKILKYIKVH